MDFITREILASAELAPEARVAFRIPDRPGDGAAAVVDAIRNTLGVTVRPHHGEWQGGAIMVHVDANDPRKLLADINNLLRGR